ncbi:MAG: glutathione synthase [Deltaproteobacteria bacterium]|nr:glutathione synthase [Deltaproteobacteria bacterium]
MKLLFLLNPYQGYNFKKDTTHLLMLEAKRRGHSVYYGTPEGLLLEGASPYSLVQPVHPLEAAPYFRFIGPKKKKSLSDFDQIWMRQDPPWDLNYYIATLILSQVRSKTLIINAPRALRDWNEKIAILSFPNFIAPTIVSSSLPTLIEFWHSQKEGVILKPLNSFGGQGVSRLKPFSQVSQRIATATLKKMTAGSVPIMAQKFLKEVHEGEKRVFLWHGKILGALKKIPPPRQYLTSPDLGGSLARTGLTAREKKLSLAVSRRLTSEGILFAGLDLIGGFLTEINVTSPGLLWELNELYGESFEKKIWDSF